MADGNAYPAQRGRGLLALNITNARRFLRSSGSKSRPISLCGFNWKLEVECRALNIGSGRKKMSLAQITAKISCTVSEPLNSIHMKAKCRFRVRHATVDCYVQEWTNSLSFDPEKDDARKEFLFAKDEDWLSEIKTDILDDPEGFLVDDTLRFLCHIDAQTIGAETADDPSRKRQQYEDVTLIVGGRRIYANTGLLAAHCEFFSAAFFGEEGFEDRNKQERELPDVDPDDFETFKAVIYPTQKALDEHNIFAVVSLADRFVAKSVLDKCEEFMLEKLDPADAFKGLSQYLGLDGIKIKFLAAMSDKELDYWATPEGRSALTKDDMELVLLENENRRVQA